MTKQASTWRYEYYITDHLGNVRVVFSDIDGDFMPDILQEQAYYPFGMEIEELSMSNLAIPDDYKYNGIEECDDLGLDVYTAVFRTYDPAIARWWQIDPRYNYEMSPYSGFGNNPILYSDILGDTIRIQVSTGNLDDSSGNAIVNDQGEVIAGNGFKSIVYTPGMEVTGEGGFADDVIMALNYIYDNADATVIEELSKSSEISNIVAYKRTKKAGFNGFNYFDSNKKGSGGSYVMFHPNMGMEFHPDTSRPNFFQSLFDEWGYRSPSEILNHELEHNRSYVSNPIQHKYTSNNRDPRYSNTEEWEAIQVENQAARCLCGSAAKIRTHHGGKYVNAKNGLYPLNR